MLQQGDIHNRKLLKSYINAIFYRMSEAHSKASKKRMAQFTKEELSQMGRDLVAKRWANTTKKERVAHARKMVEARLSKGK